MRSTTPARTGRTSPLGSPAHESLPAERMVFTEADLASRWGMSPKTPALANRRSWSSLPQAWQARDVHRQRHRGVRELRAAHLDFATRCKLRSKR